jgi:RNA exonuclease 1
LTVVASSLQSEALAKSDASSPLIYLLTPNQMLDNDYRLPSYIKPSDIPIIPGMDLGSLPPDLAAVLRRTGGEVDGNGELGIAEESYAVNPLRDTAKSKEADKGWVEIGEAVGMPENGMYPVLAIDCEMVGVGTTGSN